MTILDSILKTSATDYMHGWIDRSGQIDRETKYVSILLRSMRIVDVRQGWTKFYPVVHSYVSMPHLDGQTAEFQAVTSPSKLLALDAGHAERVVTLNQPLLGPMPYRGGNIRIEVGLFSVKSTDLAKPFLTVLEVMATAAGVSFVAVAKPFVEPLKKGIELLTGWNDQKLQIGLSTNFTKPETGYYFVVAAGKGVFRQSDLSVDKDYRLLHAGRPVSRYPYLVFSIEASDQRDDWFQIPDISAIHSDLQKAVRSGKRAEAELVFAVFERVVKTSPDLLSRDARRLVVEVKAQIDSVMTTTMTSASTRGIRNLKSVKLFGKKTAKKSLANL